MTEDQVEDAVVQWVLHGEEAKDQFTQKIRDIMMGQTQKHKTGCRCHYCICLRELDYRKENKQWK